MTGACWLTFKAPEGNGAVLSPLVYVELGSELDILGALVLLGHFELGFPETLGEITLSWPGVPAAFG